MACHEITGNISDAGPWDGIQSLRLDGHDGSGGLCIPYDVTT